MAVVSHNFSLHRINNLINRIYIYVAYVALQNIYRLAGIVYFNIQYQEKYKTETQQKDKKDSLLLLIHFLEAKNGALA